MRRIVESADGKAVLVQDLDQVEDKIDPKVVNALVVPNFKDKRLQGILSKNRIKIFSKEGFLNSCLKQYLHSNEAMRLVKS